MGMSKAKTTFTATAYDQTLTVTSVRPVTHAIVGRIDIKNKWYGQIVVLSVHTSEALAQAALPTKLVQCLSEGTVVPLVPAS